MTKTVVATLWQDQFERRDGKVTYKRPGAIAGERRSPGLSELIENFTWARDNCDGLFNVIIAIAKDKAADPRSIQECFPSKMIMKLINFDEETGAFMA
ncbi:MAG TPA: hypothetical protein VID67_03920, partial [Rhizomicrobium sp.]